MPKHQQITSNILMIRPAHFGYNPETALNNAFQSRDDSLTKEEISEKAKVEFDGFVKELRSKGIDILVYNEENEPELTDSVFPNNWISFHEDGTVITFPMFSEMRRQERRSAVVNLVESEFIISSKIAFEDYEKLGLFLEGTGSMLLDRLNRIVYGCRSVRTHQRVLADFCKKMNYTSILFDGVDHNDTPIYHTNVMMALGETFAAICLDAIPDTLQKAEVTKSLEKGGREIIALTQDQVNAFAGNMLQVRNNEDHSYLVMSTQAYKSLDPDQIEVFESHTRIAHHPIPIIEKYGGGSVRCMMAEIFLPKK